MSNLKKNLVKIAKKHVECLFKGLAAPALKYHDIKHTRRVVMSCKKMARYYDLSKAERTVLLVAAWFHDTGYLLGLGQNHEEKSAEIADHFLQNQQVGLADIAKIKNVILSSKLNEKPANLLEEIFSDADSAHLSVRKFSKLNRNLMAEISSREKRKIEKKEWINASISFFKKHTFYTDFAKKKLSEGKTRNLVQLNELATRFAITPVFSENNH